MEGKCGKSVEMRSCAVIDGWLGGQTHVLFVPVIIQRDLLVCRNWVAEDTAFHYLPSQLSLLDQPSPVFTSLFTL